MIPDAQALAAQVPLDGRVLWAGSHAHADAFAVALAEAGFVILEEAPLGPALTGLVARRDPFIIRPYQEGDEQHILPLFQASFHVERSRERWAWVYRENPYGQLANSLAWSPEGRLVASYSGYPVRLHGPGGPRTIQHIGDTMTAPDVRHRGRGPTSLLGRTVRHFYARYCQGRVAFNYGFNTANIQKFSLRFVRAQRVEPVPYRVRALAQPLPPSPFWQRLRPYRVERVHHFDARFDTLWQAARGAYGLLVERNARYLEWRYATCPEPYALYAVSRGSELVGWSVFRPKDDRLMWGDALFLPTHAHGAALAVLRQAQQDHPTAQRLTGWFPPRPGWWDEVLVSLGFEFQPEPDDLALMVVPFGEDPEAELRAGWYYTQGDGDLF